MTKSLTFSVAALLSLACASGRPSMKAATDALIATASGDHDESAPRSYEPMPWGVGQWVLLRTVERRGTPSVDRIGIVGREPNGFWVEHEHQDYQRSSVTKILYARQPRDAAEAMDAVLKVVSRGQDGTVTVVDFTNTGAAAAADRKALAPAYGLLAPQDVREPEKEGVTVTAGKFPSCARITTAVASGGASKEAVTWYHPYVPLSGFVRVESADGELEVELLDYGTTGARSKL
jgi:hypothetical protein